MGACPGFDTPSWFSYQRFGLRDSTRHPGSLTSALSCGIRHAILVLLPVRWAAGFDTPSWFSYQRVGLRDSTRHPGSYQRVGLRDSTRHPGSLTSALGCGIRHAIVVLLPARWASCSYCCRFVGARVGERLRGLLVGRPCEGDAKGAGLEAGRAGSGKQRNVRNANNVHCTCPVCNVCKTNCWE